MKINMKIEKEIVLFCLNDFFDLFKLRLENYKNFNYKYSYKCNNGKKYPLLHLSCKIGNLNMVKYLLKKDKEVLNQIENNNTPLSLSCKNGYIEIVDFLIKEGANINYENLDKNLLEIMILKSTPNHLKIIELFLKNNFDVNKPNVFKYTPLGLAINNNNKEVINLLLEYNADINFRNFIGTSCLELAFSYSDDEILLKFLPYMNSTQIEKIKNSKKFNKLMSYYNSNNKIKSARK